MFKLKKRAIKKFFMSYLYYCIYKIIEKHNLGSPKALTLLVFAMVAWCCLFLTAFAGERILGEQNRVYTGPIRSNAIVTIVALNGLFFLYFNFMGKGNQVLKRYKDKMQTRLDLFIGYGLALFPITAPFVTAAFMVVITKLGWREMSP
jgi:hypothetical protein